MMTRDSNADATQRRSAILAAEFRDMVLVLMVACVTYGGRTFTTLLVNDLVSGGGEGESASAAAAGGADESVRLMLLSAFYWGYAPPQLIGGWIAQKVGGKRAMNMCLCGMALGFFGSWALLTAPQAVLPLDVPARLRCVAALRFVDGLCQCL